jgi:hypothetical protein
MMTSRTRASKVSIGNHDDNDDVMVDARNPKAAAGECAPHSPAPAYTARAPRNEFVQAGTLTHSSSLACDTSLLPFAAASAAARRSASGCRHCTCVTHHPNTHSLTTHTHTETPTQQIGVHTLREPIVKRRSSSPESDTAPGPILEDGFRCAFNTTPIAFSLAGGSRMRLANGHS